MNQPVNPNGRVSSAPARRAGAFARLKNSTLKNSKRRSNPTGEMTLVEHLQELRRRLIISVLALVIATIVGFIWYQSAPFGISPLGEILRGPYCSLPTEKRAVFSPDGECRLLATAPFEMFMLRLKVAALAGVVLSSPFWLYQLWAFITPGLHKNERRYTLTFVSLAVILFTIGAILAYLVVSVGLEFLLSMGDEYQTAALTGERYFNFLLGLLVVFGVSFELPLIIVMLNVVGILEYDTVKDKRRIIAVAIMIFAAFMTPGQDPFSMLALWASICILVEIAFQFCRVNDKRRNRERPDWLDLDDESASPMVSASGSVGTPSPVKPAGPIAGSRPMPAPSRVTPQRPPRTQPVQRQHTPQRPPRTQPVHRDARIDPGQQQSQAQSPSQQNNGGIFDDVL